MSATQPPSAPPRVVGLPEKIATIILLGLLATGIARLGIFLVEFFTDVPRGVHWGILVVGALALTVTLYGGVMEQRSWLILYRKFRNTPLFRSAYMPVRNLLSKGWWGLFAATLVSALIALPFWMAYQDEGKAAAKSVHVPVTWLTWFNGHPYLAAVPVVWPAISAFVKRLDTLIVGDTEKNDSKMLNMLHAAREETSHYTSAILMPYIDGTKSGEEQGNALLTRLIERIYISLNVIVPGDVQVRLRVLRVQDGQITDDVGRQPQAYVSRTPMETLQDPGSTAMEAVTTKKMVIIPDLQEEVARGASSRYIECPENKAGGRGSLICYPVVKRAKGNPVAYVLCIQAPEPMVLAEVNRRFYERELGTYDADFAICDVLLGADA